MSRRNVWLCFDEWELICKELTDQKYHSFQINSYDLQNWKEQVQSHRKRNCTYEEPKYCFSRVGVYSEIEQVKSARALNILCRENWRKQDMFNMMKYSYSFIGFILTHCENVNMNTSLKDWEIIRKKMLKQIDESGENIWYSENLIELYQQSVKAK